MLISPDYTTFIYIKHILLHLPKVTLDLRIYSNVVDKAIRVLCDQIGELEVYLSKKDYPIKIRRIKYHYKELNRDFVFVSNNMDLEAFEIALLYKNRWKVEFLFSG